jgi:phage N-6-adenine-methyltransferase
VSAELLQLGASAHPLGPSEARRLTEEVKRDAQTLWTKLLRLHDGGAHSALGYSSWHSYCAAEFGFGQSHSYRLLDVGRVAEAIPQVGNEAQARALVPLLRDEGEEAVLEVWRELRTEYGDDVTADKIRRAVEGAISRPQGPHVLRASGDYEWYTPAEYIDTARFVMGGIDLDPASSAEANEVVQATTYYTLEDDGLTKDWAGRVWMNPPYARPLIDNFCAKLADSYAAGDVTTACVLVNNGTETGWFHALAEVAGAMCFPRHRVNFWHPEKRGSAALQGQAVVYLGENIKAFRREFLRFGFAVVPA